jgi:hypothetical protein
MFSYTLSLCSSLKVRNQVSHPYQTTGKITDLNILIFFACLYRKTEDLELNGTKYFPDLICFNFLMDAILICYHHFSFIVLLISVVFLRDMGIHIWVLGVIQSLVWLCSANLQKAQIISPY